jgi:hypothetical protein
VCSKETQHWWGWRLGRERSFCDSGIFIGLKGGRGVYRFLFWVCLVCLLGFDWLGKEVYIAHCFLFVFVFFYLGWNCWLFNRF